MSFDQADVEHVALLARLGLTDDEKALFSEQLGAILDHVSMLQKVDTSHLAPSARIGEEVNAWREDAARPSIPAAAALGGAPASDGAFFKVGAIQE